MLLGRLNLIREDIRLLNCAPEPFMLSFGAARLGSGYIATDYDPSLFSKWKVSIRQFDMCAPAGIANGALDCIMHNHVLEHVPCDVSGVLVGLNKLLTPGGYHLFSTPIMPERATIEDLDPTLTPEERRRLFGQEDHMRMFGSHDFMEIIDAAGMIDGLVDVSSLVTAAELEEAALSASVFHTLNSHRVFVWRKPFHAA